MATRNRKGVKLNDSRKNNQISLSSADCNTYYNNPMWKKSRKDHLKNNPLCECCLEHNKVSPGEHVHHIIPYLSGRTEEIRLRLLTDPNNLITLCKKCHYAIHEKINKQNLIGCSELTEEEFKNIHNINNLD